MAATPKPEDEIAYLRQRLEGMMATVDNLKREVSDALRSVRNAERDRDATAKRLRIAELVSRNPTEQTVERALKHLRDVGYPTAGAVSVADAFAIFTAIVMTQRQDWDPAASRVKRLPDGPDG